MPCASRVRRGSAGSGLLMCLSACLHHIGGLPADYYAGKGPCYGPPSSPITIVTGFLGHRASSSTDTEGQVGALAWRLIRKNRIAYARAHCYRLCLYSSIPAGPMTVGTRGRTLPGYSLQWMRVNMILSAMTDLATRSALRDPIM